MAKFCRQAAMPCREMAELGCQMAKFVRLLKTARRMILGGCAVPVTVYVNCAHIGVFYNRGRYNASISKQHHVLRAKRKF